MLIDHIGIACKDIDIFRKKYEMLGYKPCSEHVIDDKERNLRYLFMENNGYVIELISELHEGKQSDLGNMLRNERTFNQKMYHICYKVSNINESIKILSQNGLKLIKPPRAAIACNNKQVAFLIDYDLGVIELIEDGE